MLIKHKEVYQILCFALIEQFVFHSVGDIIAPWPQNFLWSRSLKLQRISFPTSGTSGSFQGLHFTRHILLILPCQHDAINLMDLYEDWRDVQTLQISSDYNTIEGSVKIAQRQTYKWILLWILHKCKLFRSAFYLGMKNNELAKSMTPYHVLKTLLMSSSKKITHGRTDIIGTTTWLRLVYSTVICQDPPVYTEARLWN